MQMIKDLWAKWKVSISFVGGALVVATAYGTCTVEPDQAAIQEAVLPVEQPKEEAPAEKAEESAEEVAPIPSEEVEEVEGAKEAKE